MGQPVIDQVEPDQITATRKRLGLSQPEFGKLLGYFYMGTKGTSQNQVSRWETGQFKPSPIYAGPLKWIAETDESEWPQELTDRLAMIRAGIDPDKK